MLQREVDLAVNGGVGQGAQAGARQRQRAQAQSVMKHVFLPCSCCAARLRARSTHPPVCAIGLSRGAAAGVAACARAAGRHCKSGAKRVNGLIYKGNSKKSVCFARKSGRFAPETVH